MPDRPIELRVGVRRLAGRAGDLLEWVKSRSMAIFVAALVLATVIYAGYQITLRHLLPERSGKKHRLRGAFQTLGTSRSAMRTI